jgi:plastocyanin domain-containing protein
VAADGVQRILIEARNSSYSPAALTVRAEVPTELTLRTNNTLGCTRYIIMESLGVEQSLPATGDTRIDLGTLEPGVHRYTCGMGMYRGSIEAVA